MQQRVVEGFATIFGCLDEDLQILHNLLLAAEILKGQRSQRILKVLFAL